MWDILRNIRWRQIDTGKLRLHKRFLYNVRVVENVIFLFSEIWSFQLYNDFYKKSCKKGTFMIGFQSSYKVLLVYKSLK